MSSTDLNDFRSQFLAQAETKLLAVDLATADDNSLIVKAALLRSYDSVNNFDALTIKALDKLTNMTGIQLNTWLQDINNMAEFTVILNDHSSITAIAASSTAMTAITASSTAITAVAASSTAMTAIAASSIAMTAIVASPTAMTAIAASSTARTAIGLSSIAMAALIAISSTFNWAGSTTWNNAGNEQIIVNGHGLFVGHTGFNTNSKSYIDGVEKLYTTPLPMEFTTTLGFKALINPVSLSYIIL